MEKCYFENEWKEGVLLMKEDRSAVLALGGEEMETCCPETVRGNVSGWGMPCLALESEYSKNGKYEAMAFSLDHPCRENKDWICINPVIIEDALEYFLSNHYMEEMVSGCMGGRAGGRGRTGPDFISGDAWIETNVPDAILNAAGDGWIQARSLIVAAEKAARFKKMISGMESENKRFILLTAFQHGLNDRMEGFLCRELSRFFGADLQENTEFWAADLRLEPDGITLLSYQNVTGRVMVE